MVPSDAVKRRNGYQSEGRPQNFGLAWLGLIAGIAGWNHAEGTDNRPLCLLCR